MRMILRKMFGCGPHSRTLRVRLFTFRQNKNLINWSEQKGPPARMCRADIIPKKWSLPQFFWIVAEDHFLGMMSALRLSEYVWYIAVVTAWKTHEYNMIYVLTSTVVSTFHFVLPSFSQLLWLFVTFLCINSSFLLAPIDFCEIQTIYKYFVLPRKFWKIYVHFSKNKKSYIHFE